MSCCSLQVIGLCALLNLFSSLSSAAQGDALARYPPETLRKEATTVVLPMYPRSMLSLNKGGTCCCVQDLDSCDAAALDSVRSAVSRWQFTAIPRTSPFRDARRTTKLLFLFRLTDGRPTVVDLVAAEIESRGGKLTAASLEGGH
jgi:hypothetical protein